MEMQEGAMLQQLPPYPRVQGGQQGVLKEKENMGNSKKSPTSLKQFSERGLKRRAYLSEARADVLKEDLVQAVGGGGGNEGKGGLCPVLPLRTKEKPKKKKRSVLQVRVFSARTYRTPWAEKKEKVQEFAILLRYEGQETIT